MKEIQWGVLGCGNIANTFAISLKSLDAGNLRAGASRTAGKARNFAERHKVERYYTDYESLVSDPDIDAVYVAATHNFHFDAVKLCLNHGKHVLCEKPFTLNTAQARALFEVAAQKQLFIMEAVWTRFLPSILRMQELLAEGVIGKVQSVYANFCLGKDVSVEHRLRNIDLAGGALLDLGIYPITMADLVFGRSPARIISSATMDPITGVDEYSCYLFEYEAGQKAVLSSSYTRSAPIEAIISGTQGYIRLPHFLGAQELHLCIEGEAPEILHFPYGELENFKYEIALAMKCISEGKTVSELLPPAKTLEMMEIMDQLRRDWNLTYPGEMH